MEESADLVIGKALGAYDARLSSVEGRLLTLERDLKNELRSVRQSQEVQNNTLNDIQKSIASVKGGWAVLAVIGTISATLAGIAIGISHWWRG